MKKILIIAAVVLLAIVGILFIFKIFPFNSHRRHVEIVEPIIIKDTLAAKTATGSFDTLIGHWQRIKEVTPDSIVRLDKSCNVINYRMNFLKDNSVAMEFDRTDDKVKGDRHKKKQGVWKLVKNDGKGFPYDLVLRMQKKQEIVETTNKIKTINDSVLVIITQDRVTEYFRKLK